MKQIKNIILIFFLICPFFESMEVSAALSDEFWIKTSDQKKAMDCHLLKIEGGNILCYSGRATYSYRLDMLEIVSIDWKGKNYRIKDINKDKYEGLTKAINNIYRHQSKVVAGALRDKARKKAAYQRTFEGGHRLTFKQLLDLPKDKRSVLVTKTNKACMKELNSNTAKLMNGKLNTTNSGICDYYDNVYKAHVAVRGIEAGIKLDNGEWSSASDIENLIEDKVAGDMLFD